MGKEFLCGPRGLCGWWLGLRPLSRASQGPYCQGKVNLALDGHVEYPTGTGAGMESRGSARRALFWVQTLQDTGPELVRAGPWGPSRCLTREKKTVSKHLYLEDTNG